MLLALEDVSLTDVLFECFSAVSTAGMGTGITRSLGPVSQMALVLCMYLGRLGSLTFAMALSEHGAKTEVRMPDEKIVIGRGGRGMKSLLIIGMGKFGGYLCRNLREVMIVDEDEAKIEEFAPVATTARIADCRRREVLQTLDVESFDACIVCIGEDFQSSLEITDLLRDMARKRLFPWPSANRRPGCCGASVRTESSFRSATPQRGWPSAFRTTASLNILKCLVGAACMKSRRRAAGSARASSGSTCACAMA